MAEIEAIKESHGLSTVAVHGGREMDEAGALHVPLYNHSTFGFPNTQAVLDVVEGRKQGNLYTRYGLNPTIQAVEKKLALLEGAEQAYAFSSGMAAEAATFLAHCRSGDQIICIGDVYGGTFELLGSNLPVGDRYSFSFGKPGGPAQQDHDGPYEADLLRDPDRQSAKRAMDAMMTMRKIDIASIEAARAGQVSIAASAQ
jgi:hypothetical protein